MKKITSKTIEMWKRPGFIHKVDYTMNTKYYKVIDSDDQVLMASVEPLTAIKHMTKTSELFEVTL